MIPLLLVLLLLPGRYVSWGVTTSAHECGKNMMRYLRSTHWHSMCRKPADCTQPFGPFACWDDGWATAFQSGLSALRGLERGSRPFLEADSWGHLSAASCYRQRAEHFLPLTYMFSISPDNVLPKSLFSSGKEKKSQQCPATVNCLLFRLWRGQNVLGPPANMLHHN